MIPMIPYYSYETQCRQLPLPFPPQHQNVQPGLEYLMCPQPISDNPGYKGSGKLAGKIAIITGGDSGIGRAVAIGFAKEGANVAIAYLYERSDAEATRQMVESYGARDACCLKPIFVNQHPARRSFAEQLNTMVGSMCSC